MSNESALKEAGWSALGWSVLFGLAFVALMLIRGVAWAAEKALPLLFDIGYVAVGVCILILVPMCCHRRTRARAGFGFYIASYAFGAVLFAVSCVVDVYFWGYFALVVGILLLGVGVAPIAMLAAALHRSWSVFWAVVAGIALTFGSRALGAALVARAENSAEIGDPEIPF